MRIVVDKKTDEFSTDQNIHKKHALKFHISCQRVSFDKTAYFSFSSYFTEETSGKTPGYDLMLQN
jgi:hypothetical protein